MTFVHQRDSLKVELRKGVPGVVSLYPLDESGQPLSVDSAEYEVRDRSAKVIQARTPATITPVGETGSTYSRLDANVSAIDTIDSDYSVAFFHTTGGIERMDVETFDVVAYPLGPTTTLDDLKAERPKAVNDIAGLARAIGVTSDEFASVLATRARVKLDGWLRDKVVDSAQAHGSYDRWRAGEHVFLRGHAILDRARLRRVEVLLATAALYESQMTGSDADVDSNRALHGYYAAQAKTEFDRMGRLSFDSDGDAVPDRKVRKSAGTIRLRRQQG